MCGILASLDWKGNVAFDGHDKGLDVLRHRGLDGRGFWRSPTRNIWMAHSRLSIMDPETGAQPLANETGDIRVVVNGEFYGFEEIRETLERRGHRFGTRSDSEILAHLYEDFGTDCLEYLEGEFAFVLWDERKQTLFAARDRFGIKPLFYSEFGGPLSLASEVKALQALGIPASWDVQSLFEKLVIDCPLQGRTLFRHVSELPPAHFVVCTKAGTRIRSYWDFDYPREREVRVAASDDEYAEELQALVDSAVRKRLRADVPVACYLSGGIDSSSVLGLMSRYCSNPVHAFSLALDNPAYDESALAAQTSAELNANLHPVPVTQTCLASKFSESVWHAETIFTNGHSVAKFLLSKAARDAGFKVVLTGEGADEIFAGYPAFVLDVHNHAGPEIKCFSRRLGYTPNWYRAREVFLGPLKDLFPEFDSAIVYNRLLDQSGFETQLEGRPVLNQSLFLYNKTSLPNYILTVMGDRMEMAHSIEARLPFLDRDVVEFARTLPTSQKIRGCASKYVLRKAMRLVVPPSVCGRQKWALQTPPSLLRSGPMHDLIQDTFRGHQHSFVRKQALIDFLDSSLAADSAVQTALEAPLMTLLTACILGSRFRM